MCDFVANQRLFNDTVNNAKKYYTDSLHSVNGSYGADGYSKIAVDNYGCDLTISSDKNKDGWVDEIKKESHGKTKVLIQNQNPNKDNLFDYYAEYNDNGTLYKTAQDRDKNGKYDIVTIYDKYGNLTQTIEDITNDGVPEIYTFYGENGEQLERIDTRNFITAFLDNILGREVNFD